MKMLLMIMAMIGVIAMAGTASAVPINITTADGGLNADATAGEYGGVVGALGDDGDGTGDRVVPSWGATNYSSTGILRFDLAPIAGGTVTSATLQFVDTGQRIACTLNFRGVNEGTANENWSEATILGSTAPGVIWDGLMATTMEDTGSTVTTLLGSIALPQLGEAAVWTFSSAGTELVDFLNADTDGMVNIVINYTSNPPGQKRQVASNNHASYAAPTLLLEVDFAPPIPEPAGLGLIGLALLAVRRKRS